MEFYKPTTNYIIYTDGGCWKDKRGGCGIAVYDNNKKEYIFFGYDRADKTTNNRMEIRAIIMALVFCKTTKLQNVTIYSDSSYCVNMINDWIYRWAQNNWVRANGQPIENPDLILFLYHLQTELLMENNIIVSKIKGHNGELGNELADALATGDVKKMKKLMDNNNIPCPVFNGKQFSFSEMAISRGV